jgi:hypothetical protein
MASIHITRFGGLLPQVSIKALPNDRAQIAHNCLLWDGYLRPMPQWQVDQISSISPISLYKYPLGTNGYAIDTNFRCAIRNLGEPFDNSFALGIQANGVLGTYVDQFNNRALLGIPIPNISGVSQNITSNHQSVYPIARTYAVTFVSGKLEGPPIVLPRIGLSGTLFEGDFVDIGFILDPLQINQYAIDSIKFYRTIPGFDTGEQLGNPLETGFHYVGSVSFPSSSPPATISFSDQLDSSEIPGNLLITDEWMPPPNATQRASLFFGQTEGGWAVNARLSGTVNSAPTFVEFSERFIYHAWPPQNKVEIPEYITGMAIYYDTVFLGTRSVPYVLHVGFGEAEALSIPVKPFLDTFACTPNTMVSTNFGALYAAKDGLIALTTEEDRVTTKQLASPGDILNTGNFTYHFYDAIQAGWWNNNYFGFTVNGGYIYNQPSPNDNEFPLGQLVTIDLPSGNIGPNVATGAGFFAAFGNVVYKFPLPSYGYESSPKANYTWKSKRYVMPGLTTFAAAKVVNDGSGTLSITINGYNTGQESSPSFIYTRPLTHSNPFRFPHQFKCIEFDFVLTGTSVVEELHIATDIRELTEL